MKNIIIIILVLLKGVSFGQERSCVNNVSTNPDAPTNSNLPNDNLPLVPYDLLFLNKFNWIPVNQSGTLSDLQTIGLPALGANQPMRSLYDNAVGTNDFYQYINDEVVMTTNGQGGFLPNYQNGWELIGVNLGFFPDGTPFTDIQNESNKYPTFPYVILYHRYLSKIRVFANIHDEWALEKGYNSARIRLSLNSGEQHNWNGLFRLQDGTDLSLDQETEVFSIGALAAAPNDKQRWIIADFTVAYDPCICDFSSAFNLDIELIENINFELYGRGITTTEEIVDGNGEFAETDFFGNFAVDFDDPRVVDGGFIMYKRMSDMFDDYIKRMETYETDLANVQMQNAKVKADLAIVRWAKYAVEVGVAVATGGGSVAVTLMSNMAAFAPGVVGSDPSKIPKNWEKAFKAAEKILGAEVMTYVNDNFKEKDLPATPEKPTANFTEMKFQGRLQDIDPKNGPTIYTPGTYGNSITNDLPNQHFYPVYNEGLGIFAMLESPKIKISSTKAEICLESYEVNLDNVPCGWISGGDQYTEHFISRDNTLQIKLNDDLKYMFNPALKLLNYDIKTSFEIRGGFKNPSSTYSINNINSNTYTIIKNLPKENVNIESALFDVNDDFIIKGSNQLFEYHDKLNYTTPYFPINTMKNLVSSFSYRTSFVHPQNWNSLYGNTNNLNCEGIQNYFNSKYNSCEGMSEILDKHVLYYEQREVYLKLLINITYEGEKSDGTAHEYTYVYSYKVSEEDIEWDFLNELSPNLPGSSFDFTQYPENLFLEGTNFDGSPIDGCNLNGTTYTCNAWNEVTLSGDFAVSSGYNVIIDAGTKITELPEATIPVEMVRQITVLDYSSPMPPVDQTFVADFCSLNGAYKARSSKMPLFNNDSTTVYEEDRRDIFAFNIFPNPTSGSSTVSITLNESAKGDLFITDMNGRTLGTAFKGQTLRAGQTDHSLPTASLASGIYLVHLFIDGERHVKRLVKQ